ncbi:MAG: hypothetical protein LBR94_02585 [Desulfovibrio sp.]|jgi:hypothetical protein|nr:hypothetical protein [Desulfovibrio sp.]
MPNFFDRIKNAFTMPADAGGEGLGFAWNQGVRTVLAIVVVVVSAFVVHWIMS